MIPNFQQRVEHISAWYTQHARIVQIALAFAVLRAMAALLLRPGGYIEADGAINSWLYSGYGSLGASGQYPFIDYWVEYPPIFPWMSVGLYRIVLRIPAWFLPRAWYNTLFALAMVPFELGCLIVIYLLVHRLHDRARAEHAAVLYALLFGPLFISLSQFDAMEAFFLLLGLYGLVAGSPIVAGIGVGVGFGVKLFSIVLVPAAVRVFAQPRRLALFAAVMVLCLTVIFLPFLILGTDHTLAFFRQLGGRNAYQTVWAALEGFPGFGTVAPLYLRNDPAAAAWVTEDYTSRLPWVWIAAAFAALGLFLYTRRVDWQNPLRSTAFAGLTLGLFLLYSKGHSPGWNLYLMAMALVLFPGMRGLLYGIAFGIVAAFDWPLLLLAPTLPGAMAMAAAAQAALTITLCIDCAALVWPDAAPLALVRRYALPVVLAGLVVLGVTQIGPGFRAYAENRLSYDPLKPVIEGLRADPSPAPVIVVQPTMLERVQPYLLAGQVRMIPHAQDFEFVGHLWAAPDEWLPGALVGQDRAWLLFDNREEGRRDIYHEVRVWLDTHGCAISQAWYDTDWAGHYALGEAGEMRPVAARFAAGVAVTGAAYPDSPLRAGNAFCVRLAWRAGQPLAADYVVFVHVLDASGALAAQSDLWPDVPTSAWGADQAVTTSHGLWLPPTLPAGRYTLRAGLYNPGDGMRLRLENGDDGVTLAELVVGRTR